jgi:hypothetical protein
MSFKIWKHNWVLWEAVNCSELGLYVYIAILLKNTGRDTYHCWNLDLLAYLHTGEGPKTAERLPVSCSLEDFWNGFLFRDRG